MSSALIVGCGYVGCALARVLHEGGWRVGAVVRSERSAHRIKVSLPELEVFHGDVAETDFWNHIPLGFEDLIYCPSTGGGGLEAYRALHETGLGHALNYWKGRRLIYTSSTSVYSQNDGSWVDEDSPAEPEAETAQCLRSAEEIVCKRGGVVLRLGGLYGPERGVLWKRLLDGTAVIPEVDPKWLNLIHRDDAVSAIEWALQNKPTGVYNTVDNEPASYRQIYQWLCGESGLMMPMVGQPDYLGRRGINNRRISNRKVRSAGWSPRYPSFREGYAREIAQWKSQRG